MSTTLAGTNGHADTSQRTADTGHDMTHDTSQPKEGPERVTVDRLAKKQVLVQPKTFRLLRHLATRLDRTNDAVIRRALHLLDKETKAEQVKSDDDWADEVAS